jgi:hypothetical protein
MVGILLLAGARKLYPLHCGRPVYATVLLHAAFLLGLFFKPENGGDMRLQNFVDSQQTTQPYIPEDIRTLIYDRIVWNVITTQQYLNIGSLSLKILCKYLLLFGARGSVVG